MKLETPVTQVLPMLPPLFTDAPGNGGNYILFVTDGEPDFCDDGNRCMRRRCGRRGAEAAQRRGITTNVIGLSSNFNTATCPGVFQAYANAGVNQPIADPCARAHSAYDECHANAIALRGQTTCDTDWAAPRVRRWSTTQPPPGPHKSTRPTSPIRQVLINTLAGLFSGVKSCTFDLNNIDSGQADDQGRTPARLGWRRRRSRRDQVGAARQQQRLAK